MDFWMNVLCIQPARNGVVKTYFYELLILLSHMYGLRRTPEMTGDFRPLAEEADALKVN